MDSASRTSSANTLETDSAASPPLTSPLPPHAPSAHSPHGVHTIHDTLLSRIPSASAPTAPPSLPPHPQQQQQQQRPSTTHLGDIYIGDYSDSENESTGSGSTATSVRHVAANTAAPSAPQPLSEAAETLAAATATAARTSSPTTATATAAQDVKDQPSSNAGIDQSSTLPYAPQHLRQLEEEKYRVQQHEEQLERQHLEEQHRLQQQQQQPQPQPQQQQQQQQQSQRLLRGRHHPSEDDDQVYEMSSMSPVPAYQSAIFDDAALYMDPSVGRGVPSQPQPQQQQQQMQQQVHGQTLATVDPFATPQAAAQHSGPGSPNRPSESSQQHPSVEASEASERRRSRPQRPGPRTQDGGRPSRGFIEGTRTGSSSPPSATTTTVLASSTTSSSEQYRDGRRRRGGSSSPPPSSFSEKPMSLVDRFRILAGYGMRRRHDQPQPPPHLHRYQQQQQQQHNSATSRSTTPRVLRGGMVPAAAVGQHRLSSSRSELMDSHFSTRQNLTPSASSPRYPRSERSGASPRVSGSIEVEAAGRAMGGGRVGVPVSSTRTSTGTKVVMVRKTGVPGKNGQEPETDLFNFIDIMLDMPERPGWHEVMMTLAKVLVVMAVSYFALMALYFAAEFQADQSLGNINVAVVDFDFSMVGSEFITYTNSVNNNPRKINWVIETTKYKTQQQVMDDVNRGKYWGAVVIQPNSSRSLFSALSLPNKEYDPTRAFTLIYDGGRNPLVTRPVVVSGMYMHFVDFIKTFNSKWIFTVLSLAQDGNQTLTSLIDTPWVLGTPVAFQELDLHPPTASILSSATTVAYIWVFLVAGGSTYLVANTIQPMTRHVSVARTMCYMLAPLAVFLTVLSMVYSLLLLTFGVPFDGFSQFMALFGSMFLLQCSVSAMVLFLIFLVPVVYIPSITITYVIMNVIAVFNTVELMPVFYRWVHAMPFLNAVQMARYVLLGSYNRLATNVPILFAWIVVPIMLLPFAIARQKRLVIEVEERALREQGMNLQEMQRIPADEKLHDSSGFSSHWSSGQDGEARRRHHRHRRGRRRGEEEGHLSDRDSYLSDEEDGSDDDDLVYETTSEHTHDDSHGSHDEGEEEDEYGDDTLPGHHRRSRFIRQSRSRVAPDAVTATGRHIHSPFVTAHHPVHPSTGSSLVMTGVTTTTTPLSAPRGPAPYVAPMPPVTFRYAIVLVIVVHDGGCESEPKA
ncbi:hypothetical protein DFQ27_004065 [Actinomortierella ambigua]|uniref:DUF3533 domain-containing protein n=1 Tax=Actinomortierella ambigua TaxID=1343610 RepID=A0A9P6Q4W0_9FUNG|nr:hypothetical protein DFQ27_004065 [Actinomortierella ambigua]